MKSTTQTPELICEKSSSQSLHEYDFAQNSKACGAKIQICAQNLKDSNLYCTTQKE